LTGDDGFLIQLMGIPLRELYISNNNCRTYNKGTGRWRLAQECPVKGVNFCLATTS